MTRRESGVESESVCEPYCAPRPVNSDCTYEAVDDGWNASRDSPLVPLGLPSSRNRLGSRLWTT